MTKKELYAQLDKDIKARRERMEEQRKKGKHKDYNNFREYWTFCEKATKKDIINDLVNEGIFKETQREKLEKSKEDDLRLIHFDYYKLYVKELD